MKSGTDKNPLGRAQIMLHVALLEICQLQNSPHLVRCDIRENAVEGFVLLPYGGWPAVRICEDSRVLRYLDLHGELLKMRSVLGYLESSRQRRRALRLRVLLAGRDYSAAIAMRREISAGLPCGVRERLEAQNANTAFYWRPELRARLEIARPSSLRVSLQSSLESPLEDLEPLVFAPTSSLVAGVDEAREVILTHLAAIRPFAVRYLRLEGLDFLRRREEEFGAGRAF